MDEPDATRIETSSFGPVKVAAKQYWQTQLSLGHFAIGSQTMPLAIIRALAMVKRAAAEANRDQGFCRPAYVPRSPSPAKSKPGVSMPISLECLADRFDNPRTVVFPPRCTSLPADAVPRAGSGSMN